MNWLAKINIRVVIERLGLFKSALFLVALIAVCLFTGYRVGNFFHNYQTNKIETQKQQLVTLHQLNEQQTRRVHTLEVELEVERLANEQSQALLTTIEQQHYQAKKQLAFYQKVMAPEKQADGVVLDSIVMAETGSTNHYRFQVMLVQQNKNKRFAKGHVELLLEGSLDGKPYRLKLSEMSSLDKKAMSFSFQYFQAIEGELSLPEGFIPEQLQALVILPKSRWQKPYRVEHKYPWQKILVIKNN